MRGQTRSNERERSAIRQRRAERAAQSKLNRAQLRAMEIRAAETLAAEPETAPPPDVVNAAGAAVALPSRRAASMSRRVIARPIVLTKEQEYRFIRSDMKRLVITAVVLFVLMIVLLLVVEA